MAESWRSYLASTILSEGVPVTYRTFSRAQNIHVNIAKQMLFEFYEDQQTSSPASIHATYLIGGIRKPCAPVARYRATQESDMFPSSPPHPSSSMPDGCTNEEPSVRHITLVGEENLEIVKQLFLKITSIHIYSLQPCPLKDFQILCNSAQLGIDSLESRKIYGSIQNLEMKTRGRTAPLPNPPAAPKATNSKPASKIEAVKELKQKAPEVHASVIKTQARQKSLKRDSSDIFKAFSKTKPKLKGKESQSEATSPVADSPVASASEDDPMKDVGDDDDDDTFVPPPSRNLNKAESNSRAKEMARKKEELTRMMDDNDEPMPDSSAPNEQDSQESIATDANQSQDTQTSIVQPIQSSGRRRGKRRVVKKKTVKDAEGYIVTIEEPAWESYSEDEPAPVSKPQQSHASHASKSSGKSKRGGGAASKGNIASFFSKK